jgi:predicted nucleotidyltransferase
MTLHFDTKPEWIDTLRSWAASEAMIMRVWLFGSRVTGRRRNKAQVDPTPDLDVAYEMTGAESGELLAHSIFEIDRWRQRLAEIPVPVDLQLADRSDLVVWPAVLDHGRLIFERASERGVTEPPASSQSRGSPPILSIL